MIKSFHECVFSVTDHTDLIPAGLGKTSMTAVEPSYTLGTARVWSIRLVYLLHYWVLSYFLYILIKKKQKRKQQQNKKNIWKFYQISFKVFEIWKKNSMSFTFSILISQYFYTWIYFPKILQKITPSHVFLLSWREFKTQHSPWGAMLNVLWREKVINV